MGTRSWRRAVGLALVVGATLITVSACSPAQTGLVAVSINSDGVPVVVFQDCEDGGGLATISVWVSRQKQRYHWESPSGDVSPALVVMNQQSDWATETSINEFAPGVEYNVGAWSEKQARSSSQVEFTLEDLYALGPGELLISRYNKTLKDFVAVTVSSEKFLNSGCSEPK